MNAKFEICNESIAIAVFATLSQLGWDFQVKRGAAFYFTVDCEGASRLKFMENTAKYYAFRFTTEVVVE